MAFDKKAYQKEYYKDYYIKHIEMYRNYSKDWHQKNKEKVSENHSNLRAKYKQQVYDAYGHKCICCGETISEFLSIDHIRGGGQEHRKSLSGGCGLYKYIVDNNFPSDFQILCMNCNFAKGHSKDGLCPHERERNNA